MEYEAIVAHGFLLQIDAPDLAMERHVSYQDRPLGDFIGFVERVVATINAALANVPRDRVRLHACWGNYEGPHDCDVALPEILPAIRQAKVGGLVLPFANPRHAHEYRCLKDLPLDDGQVIVAGVIDPLTNFVEHPEVVADRHRTGGARRRRSSTRAGRHRLRLRYLGRPRPRGGRCGLGQAGGDGGRRADRHQAAVLTPTLPLPSREGVGAKGRRK